MKKIVNELFGGISEMCMLVAMLMAMLVWVMMVVVLFYMPGAHGVMYGLAVVEVVSVVAAVMLNEGEDVRDLRK